MKKHIFAVKQHVTNYLKRSLNFIKLNWKTIIFEQIPKALISIVLNYLMKRYFS